MDITLLSTKIFDIYLSTLQVGVGISYVPSLRSLHLNLVVFEFVFYFGMKEWIE